MAPAPAFAPPRSEPRLVTGALIERTLGRCMAAFCVVFGPQAVPFILEQHILPMALKVPILVILYGAFIVVAISGALGRSFAVTARIVTIVFLIVLAGFPVVATHPEVESSHGPWLWYLCALAIAFGVFAYDTWIAGIYSVIVPTLYFVVRQTPPGGGATAGDALLESLYVFVLGTAVVILVVVIRRAAASVDSAQAAAIRRYGEAVRAHALEVERVEVDAIVHDGVLTTLISAAKADTPAATALAADMARISMERLIQASRVQPDSEHPVPLTAVRARLAAELQRLDARASLTPEVDVPAMLLPVDVAETLFSAALQALVNSCQHAGSDASRHVRIRVVEGVAEIAVTDDGAGFDTTIPSERLGVRVSILERVKNAGGDALIRSHVGGGTVVTLRWTSESRSFAPLRA